MENFRTWCIFLPHEFLLLENDLAVSCNLYSCCLLHVLHIFIFMWSPPQSLSLSLSRSWVQICILGNWANSNWINLPQIHICERRCYMDLRDNSWKSTYTPFYFTFILPVFFILVIYVWFNFSFCTYRNKDFETFKTKQKTESNIKHETWKTKIKFWNING